MTFQESIFLFLEGIVHRARESAQDSRSLAESSHAFWDAAALVLINTIESQEFLKQKGIWATLCCLFQSLLGQAVIMLGPGCSSDWHHSSDLCLEGPKLPVCPAVQERGSAVCDALLLLPISP